MKIADAPAIINGVHIMEFQVDATSPLFKKLSASYALVSATKLENEEGHRFQTHGKCAAYPTNWSQKTIELLHGLIDSMEEDLLARHFETEKEEVHEKRAGYLGEEGPAQV